ncbi:MAG: penicillin acylase family protein [Candidatus Hodarchaeota archaeon]
MLGKILRFVLIRMSRKRLPKISGKLELPGLLDTVEVIRDKFGIPHIYANNTHDLYFAQGFVHAQDRLWQMELNRRTATGRLSEIFGDLALDTDRTTRTFGFARLGQKDWENADNEVRAGFQAYSDGVNAFLQHPSSKLPIEFTLSRHKPEPWKPEESFAFSRVVLWQLSHAWYGEIIRARLIDKVGAEHAADLEIEYPDTNPTTLPNGIDFNILNDDGSFRKAQGPFLDRGKGSNMWVVSGHKSTTGAPFLCNDMHLKLMTPSLWYEIHLIGDEFNVSGVSLAGLPLVMVGHNSKIAWGMTLAYTDAEDLFIEKMHLKDPTKYEFRGEWVDAEVISESIKIKGQSEPHIEKVVITKHGSIISDVVDYSQKRIAVKSMALRPCQATKGWLLLNKASSWNDFVEAVRYIEAPQLNISYADTEGNIGHWVSGKVPIRAKGNGMIPAPGWTGEYEWIGEVPFEEMPHALNPEKGFVVNCNHRIIPDDYPHYLGSCWMNGYRAQRIEEVLENKEKVSVEDFKALQNDVMCIPGLELKKRLKNHKSSDPDVQIALELLNSWDGQLTTTSIGGTVYEVTLHCLIKNILVQALGEELTYTVMGKGFHPLLYSSHEFHGYESVNVLNFLDNPDSWWLKQAGGREKVLNNSLKEAVEWLRKNLGKNVNKWQWGKIHRATFPHSMALQKPLDKVFNCGPFPIGGGADTPMQTAMFPDEPYDVKSWAPSHRQIIDMGDLTKSLMIHGPGQSGHLGSPHYNDLAELWIKGEYHPMLWTREQIEAESDGKLILKP